MFLKNAKKLSITARLTLSYALSTLLILLVACFYSYWQMIDIVYKGNLTFLSDEMDVLQKTLPLTKVELKSQVIDVPAALWGSIYRFYVRVLDKNGKTFMVTPTSENIFPHPKSVSFNTRSIYTLKTKNNNEFLLMETKLPLGRIQIALNTSYQYQLISKYRYHEYLKKILTLFAISGFFAFILGYLITRHGLKPLRELVHTSQKITISSLNQRINPALWPNELKSLGNEYNKMLARIENSFLRLIQFADDLAHELRTPVNNMMGSSEILLSSSHSVAEYQQLVGSNLEELQRISQIIENLLFLARVENPQYSLEKNSLAVHHEISFICEYLQAIAEEKNIRIVCEGQAVLSANFIMFRRVINNLLTNALKYTPQNGLIQFAIESLDEEICITVKDTGIGIAEPHLGKIFDRFYRISTDRSLHSGGVGLGLAIVKSIVQLHQGTIQVYSVLNEGTTFVLTFPKVSTT